ncbi:acetyl-CoA carboxylase, carboxyltransferase subunit beta [Clostridium grantii]|uniref:Acetyl-coenzyme A carboxylase carboxyl transferase subunit beta n=1 Tax=Clostridium grantii DSM 8605 TaxID=1121316 RepID=A0A1M5W4J3_9CLOT|nr:acetyl-CoA carboxylase, carboxyltransferase subunit beta [Clostridium grantii]SHH82380.1 acetyl-CoA carboxylase carboxyl transferase subunit beta [Clostridium grantii DSM 8605]
MFKLNKVFKKTKYITLTKEEDINVNEKSKEETNKVKKIKLNKNSSKGSIENVENKIKEDENDTNKPNIPNGLWIKCGDCGEVLYKKDFDVDKKICLSCGKHYRMSARERIYCLIDEESFIEFDKEMKTMNPLNFQGYEEKISKYQASSKVEEAIVTGYGTILGKKTVIGVMDSNFMMGSMGSVVGEKLTRAVEYATENKLPVIVFTASGGARMQEGIFSLMQMAKTSAAIEKHNEAGLLYISVLTDPTTGGVTASFAMLGDIILSEPGALIGFAGKRVIEQTIKQKLPKGFQTAEFLLEHGFIDKIVARSEMKETLANIIEIHQ